MKKIFIVMMIAGILTGCSDSSTKSITVCKGSFDYGDIENTYEAKGDKVIRIVNVTINDYRDTDYDDETLVSTLESQLNVYNEVGLIDLNGDGTVSFEKLTKNAKENKLTCKEK